MTQPTVKERLKGAFDLFFLFGRGIQPFEKGDTKKTAMQSLWILAVCYPLGMLSAYLWPPADLAKDVPMTNVLLSTAAESVLGFFTGVGLLWLACIAFNRRERFWTTFAASIWAGIPSSLIGVPFLLLALAHWYDREIMDRIFTVILYYGFLVTACVYFRGLKIHWEWAGFLACMGIVIGQLTQNFFDYLNGVPIR